MGFSEIIKGITKQEEEQRQGRPKEPYNITLQNVVEDYNRLLQIYNNISSLSRESLISLKNEVSKFYQIVERATRSYNALSSSEQSKLYAIFLNVKDINRKLDERVKIIAPQENC